MTNTFLFLKSVWIMLFILRYLNIRKLVQSIINIQTTVRKDIILNIFKNMGSTLIRQHPIPNHFSFSFRTFFFFFFSLLHRSFSVLSFFLFHLLFLQHTATLSSSSSSLYFYFFSLSLFHAVFFFFFFF